MTYKIKILAGENGMTAESKQIYVAHWRLQKETKTKNQLPSHILWSYAANLQSWFMSIIEACLQSYIHTRQRKNDTGRRLWWMASIWGVTALHNRTVAVDFLLLTMHPLLLLAPTRGFISPIHNPKAVAQTSVLL